MEKVGAKLVNHAQLKALELFKNSALWDLAEATMEKISMNANYLDQIFVMVVFVSTLMVPTDVNVLLVTSWILLVKSVLMTMNA